MKFINLKDYRCEFCQKLLFKAMIQKATIEIKCKSCKNIIVIISED